MVEYLPVILLFVVALGSGALSFIVAQARMQVAMAQDREELVEARALLTYHRRSVEERVRAAEAESRRKALDEFLADVRVEERHYVREIRSPSERRKCMVVQERICFRNIPLSQWIEHEHAVEESGTGRRAGGGYLPMSSIRAAISSRNEP
jgi:hypothetical protein